MVRLDTMIAESADVAPSADLGTGTRVWHLVQIREHASIGNDCIIGRGAYVDHGVRIGSRCKIQNYAMIYSPSVLADGVFVGPGAILANDRYPRAIGLDGELKGDADWDPIGVEVGEGASIGAAAVLIGGATVGRWAMVGAAAVVTEAIPDFALAVGAPARVIGWVGRSGRQLVARGGGRLVDPDNGEQYLESEGKVEWMV